MANRQNFAQNPFLQADRSNNNTNNSRITRNRRRRRRTSTRPSNNNTNQNSIFNNNNNTNNNTVRSTINNNDTTRTTINNNNDDSRRNTTTTNDNKATKTVSKHVSERNSNNDKITKDEKSDHSTKKPSNKSSKKSSRKSSKKSSRKSSRKPSTNDKSDDKRKSKQISQYSSKKSTVNSKISSKLFKMQSPKKEEKSENSKAVNMDTLDELSEEMRRMIQESPNAKISRLSGILDNIHRDTINNGMKPPGKKGRGSTYEIELNRDSNKELPRDRQSSIFDVPTERRLSTEEMRTTIHDLENNIESSFQPKMSKLDETINNLTGNRDQKKNILKWLKPATMLSINEAETLMMKQEFEKVIKANLHFELSLDPTAEFDPNAVEFNPQASTKSMEVKLDAEGIDVDSITLNKTHDMESPINFGGKQGSISEDSRHFFGNFAELGSITDDKYDAQISSIYDEIKNEADFIKLIGIENDLNAKLNVNIQGKWTRRFVQKRTKPKIINQLIKARLSLLLKYKDDDIQVWKEQEMQYIKLIFHCRFYYDTLKVILSGLNKFGPNYSNNNLLSIIHDERFAQFTLPHTTMFQQILNELYADTSTLEDNQNSEHKFPNINRLVRLEKKVRESLPNLQIILWKYHDEFYDLDDKIEKELQNGLNNNFEKNIQINPLVFEKKINFRGLVKYCGALVKTSHYLKRKICHNLNAIMGEFERYQKSFHKFILHSYINFVKYLLGNANKHENITEMFGNFKTAINTINEDTTGVTKAFDALDKIQTDADEFFTEEFAEIDRLVASQILLNDWVSVENFGNIQQIKAFKPMVPTKHIESGLNKICLAIVTEQGMMYLYDNANMNEEELLLCCHIKELDQMHVGRAHIEFRSGKSILDMRFKSTKPILEWTEKLSEYFDSGE